MTPEILCIALVLFAVLTVWLTIRAVAEKRKSRETRRELYRNYLRQCLSVKRMVVDLRHAKTDKQRTLVVDGISVYAGQLEHMATQAGKEFTE